MTGTGRLIHAWQRERTLNHKVRCRRGLQQARLLRRLQNSACCLSSNAFRVRERRQPAERASDIANQAGEAVETCGESHRTSLIQKDLDGLKYGR